MKISFEISAELAQTLAEECELTHTVLDNVLSKITPAEFAKECLESELASRRLEKMPKRTGHVFLFNEKKSIV